MNVVNYIIIPGCLLKYLYGHTKIKYSLFKG